MTDGWVSCAATLASRKNRSRKTGWVWYSGAHLFESYPPLQTGSVTRKTSPIPPLPRLRTTLNCPMKSGVVGVLIVNVDLKKLCDHIPQHLIARGMW